MDPQANKVDEVINQENINLKKPMWITDFIVKRHLLIIIFGTIILAAFTVLSLYYETYLLSPDSDRDYFV